MPKSSAAKATHQEPERIGEATSGFVFRPIHYLGSKLRILPAIEQAIDRVDPSGGAVCDLFSGSATVARYLSRRRRVLAADVQEYARVLAEAVLNGDPSWSAASVIEEFHNQDRNAKLHEAISPLVNYENKVSFSAMRGDVGPLCDLLELGNLASLDSRDIFLKSGLNKAAIASKENLIALELAGYETVCVRHFGGQYFSYAQSADMDALIDLARKNKSPVLLAAALSTASQLVNSIGKQFAQPIRPRNKSGEPKMHVIKKIVTERSLSAQAIFLNYIDQYENLEISRRDHVAVRSDFRETLANPAFKPSVVYADPPYTRDHYSRFYHSLETIALGDDPDITQSNLGGGDIKSRGGYRAGRHQSPFCIKSAAPGAFSALFGGVAALRVPLVLSYSGYDPSVEARPRVMALDAVVSLAKQHFKNVEVEQVADFDHIKLNTTSLNKAARGTTEVIILCS